VGGFFNFTTEVLVGKAESPGAFFPHTARPFLATLFIWLLGKEETDVKATSN
jgi:hypothetical protein